MIRAVILATTIAALICMWGDRPAPSRMVDVPYCEVDKRVAVKEFLVKRDKSPILDANGEPVWRWHFEWEKRYAPCTELDRYEFI